jgi:hypothetical protein
MWEAFIEELRTRHLGKKPGARSVLADLRAAYEQVLAAVEAEAG